MPSDRNIPDLWGQFFEHNEQESMLGIVIREVCRVMSDKDAYASVRHLVITLISIGNHGTFLNGHVI